MSNTLDRTKIKNIDLWNIRKVLWGSTMTGEQASRIIDDLHDCIVEDSYMEYGSVDLNDIACRMHHEIGAFEESP